MSYLKNLTSIIVYLCLWALALTAYSQERKAFKPINSPSYDVNRTYHFGFSLGLNQLNFLVKPIEDLQKVNMRGEGAIGFMEFDTLYSVLSRPELGLNIGIVSNLRLSPHWDLRFIPTITFGDRYLEYYGIKNESDTKLTEKIESTFLDFPIHFKYKSVRMTNTRVYVLAGLKYSHDLASAEDKDNIEDLLLVRIYKNDFYYEFGVGFDYYFIYNFKFSTEIKASFGIRDMLQRENNMFSNSIDRLNSQIIMVSFLFE